MMDVKIKTDWLKALRSGEYEKTTSYLRRDGGFCCLGVLCAIQGETFEGRSQSSLATSKVPEKYAAGLSRDEQEVLAHLNDEGKSFAEIADVIERDY